MKTLLTLVVALLAMLAGNMAQAREKNAVEPKAGAVWVEPATGMKFVWIPAGCFVMTPPKTATHPLDMNHKVCFKGFYLGMYEVTQKQYLAMTGKNPSKFSGDDHPVEQVSYNDARAAVDALNGKAGGGFRVPSEAEWEYACRAGGIHKQNCGEGDVQDLAWDVDSSEDEMTSPVGKKAPNAWGLYDMNGNVWEWVADCWHDHIEDTPVDGSAWKEPGSNSCSSQMVRGGSFADSEDRMFVGYRDTTDPNEINYSIGFRLARTPQ